MERRDGGVGPVALGLGREAEHDDPRDQAAERDHERDRPRSREIGERGAALACRCRRRVACEDAQEEVRGDLEGGVEEDGAEAADDADARAQDDPLAQVARVPDAAPERAKPSIEASGGDRRHANRSSSAAMARSPSARSSRSGS